MFWVQKKKGAMPLVLSQYREQPPNGAAVTPQECGHFLHVRRKSRPQSVGEHMIRVDIEGKGELHFSELFKKAGRLTEPELFGRALVEYYAKGGGNYRREKRNLYCLIKRLFYLSFSLVPWLGCLPNPTGMILSLHPGQRFYSPLMGPYCTLTGLATQV